MKRILIVDDEPDMRLAIKNVLKLRGYDIEEAGDGPEALEKLSAKNVDLVLLDIRLPGIDGVEVLERIRKKDKNIPVVMITGYGHIRSAVDVMKLGANEYLQKPFENTKLISIVKKFLDGAAKPEIPAGVFPSSGESIFRGKSRKAALGAAGFALLLLLIFAFQKFRSFRKAYPIETSNISSMFWNGDEYVYLGDWIKESVYKYRFSSGNLMPVKTYPLKNVHISSLTGGDGYLYVADSWAKEIRKLKLPEMALDRIYKTDSEIISVFYRGEKIYALDNEGNLETRDANNNLALLSSVKLKNRPDQIFVSGKYLWSASSTRKRIYKHELSSDMKILKTYSVKGLEGDYPLSAFVVRKGRLWIARDGDNRVYEMGFANLKSE